MGEQDISARLRALAADEQRRPETARLRDVFDDIEAALRAGVPQAEVLAELHRSGFKMTIASFKSALQRIRKERRSNDSSAADASPGNKSVPKGTEGGEQHRPRINNPGDLRKSRRRDIDLDNL